MVLRSSGNNYCNRNAFVLFIVYRQDINREIAISDQCPETTTMILSY